jgi:histidyl-tRNA synthetase
MKAGRIQSLRGFNDVLPDQVGLWQQVEAVARETFAAYAYREIRTPLLEQTALFKRAIGDVTDVVEKEMFSFDDREGDNLSLRPEGTASCVRAGLEHGLLHNQQQRFWYAGPMFRHERPQAGRYRQFHQLGAEAFGMDGPDIDVEIIALSARLLQRLGLQDVQLEINSLGSTDSRARHRAALIDFLEARREALDPESQRRLKQNPLRVLDAKSPQTQAAVADAPSLLDYLDAEDRAHFDGLRQGLDDLGIAYVLNPRIVRGLDYYSRTVFEWTTTALGAQGTVCAGGRYDGLVAQLGGQPAPAVGWASGIERLILLLKAQAAPGAEPAPHAALCSADEDSARLALKLAEDWRRALPGLRLLFSAGGGKLKAQLGRAEKLGCPWALVIGEAERADATVQVKSLVAADPPRQIPLAELPGWLAARLDA